MILGHASYSNTELGDVKVGNYSSIARECHFHDKHDNHHCVVNKKCVYTYNWDQGKAVTDRIEIGSDVWMGMGVKVLPGVKIGDGVIVGAWSVVTKDVPSYAFVAGNPAQIKRYRFTPEQIEKLLKIKWWDWPEDKIDTARKEGHMDDIDKFLEIYD